MPVLSQYWFHNGFFQGPFDVFNEPYPDGGWAWISNGSSSAATLAWNRPDGEHAVDLAAQPTGPGRPGRTGPGRPGTEEPPSPRAAPPAVRASPS
jgi:hypothetical protein